MKRARRHYGIGLRLPFRENKDPEEKASIDDFYNEKYCLGRVQWLISKVCDQIPSVYTIFVANGKIDLGRGGLSRHFQNHLSFYPIHSWGICIFIDATIFVCVK
jgi:hypothetical protein